MLRSKQTAHAELDDLRQQAAAERVRARDLEAQLEAAKLEVESAGQAVTDAYAAEDAKLAGQRREELQAAETDVLDLQHRVTGAALRVERAQQHLDEYQRAHARDLLAEREQPARTVALDLSRAVGETLRLHRAYLTERQTMDQLVAAVPGATPRADGPGGSHPWEPALGQLARAYQQTPQLEPPLPRWQGLEHREAEDNSARRLQLQRRKKLTADEQDELDRLNRDRVPTPPVAMATEQP